MTNILTWLVALQGDIQRSVADQIIAFSASGDWLALFGTMPLAIMFGMAHALTPGHNKLVLATYVLGERLGLLKALATSMLLSATHIGSAVAIGFGANWLVSRTITQAGRAPLLEMISHALLVAIAIWMIWRANRPATTHRHSGLFAFAAGLVPCPLTLFLTVMASSWGTPEAGLIFAAAMLFGVGSVLCIVALITHVMRERAAAILSGFGGAESLTLGFGGSILLLLALVPLAGRLI